MSNEYTVVAEQRAEMGKGASRRLRRVAKVPAILYGAGQPPISLTIEQKGIARQLQNEKFYSKVLTVSVGGVDVTAVLKDVQRHPYKPIISHVDFLRVNANEKIHMRVPLHFTGGATAPGIKLGGLISHSMTDLEIACLPGVLPEFIEVDVSAMNVGDIVHISDLKLPEGVVSVGLLQGPSHDLAVVSMHVPRGAVEAVATAAAAPAAAAAKAAPAKTAPAKKAGK